MTNLRLAVLAIATGLTLACSTASEPTAAPTWDDSALEKPSWAVGSARVAEFESAYPFRYHSGVGEKERLVILDADAWTALWARLSTPMAPTPPLPPVDFATEMVLFVSQGVQSNGGYSIAVKHVAQGSVGLEVMVESVSPGRNCVTTAALTEPTHAVIVPRTELAVIFLERHRVQECG